MKDIEKTVEEFKGKLHKYDKDDGFIVYVEGYDNQDFDVDLIVDYFEKSLTQTREEGRKEERERIRKIFKEECAKNLKEYGGSFVSYEFEPKYLTNTK